MNKFLLTLAFAFAFSSCSERQTLEEKAQHDVHEYNRRYCPTPVINYMRTDSITFDAARHIFTYHCSFCGMLDNKDLVMLNKEKITNMLQNNVKRSTSIKNYIESGYHFRYVCRSDSLPQTILFEIAF